MTGVEIMLGAFAGIVIAIAITAAKCALIRHIEEPRSQASPRERASRSRGPIDGARRSTHLDRPVRSKGDR